MAAPQSSLFAGRRAHRSAATSGHNHPAVALYRELCNRKPTSYQRQAIIETVGDSAPALALYREVLDQFMFEGRPPQRVDWTLERFVKALPRATAKSVATINSQSEMREFPAQPVTDVLWQSVLDCLSERLSAESLQQWFGPVRFIRTSFGAPLKIFLAVPHSSIRDWICANYQTVFELALAESGMPGFTVEWTIEESE